VPIGVVERASLNNGLNYLADTLMFCGAMLLLAGAMPREAIPRDDRNGRAAVDSRLPIVSGR